MLRRMHAGCWLTRRPSQVVAACSARAPPANESNNTYRGFRKLRAHQISVNLTSNAETQCQAAAKACYLAKPCVWPLVSPLPAVVSLICKPRAARFAKSEVVPITNIIHHNEISAGESRVTSWQRTWCFWGVLESPQPLQTTISCQTVT